jgi:hypothetical protein
LTDLFLGPDERLSFDVISVDVSPALAAETVAISRRIGGE